MVLLEPDTYSVVAAAVGAHERTGGRFDPTVERSMANLGYDRSLDTIDTTSVRGVAPLAAPGCADVELIPSLGAVRLPPGVGIDLGGIGKGAAADLVSASLMNAGADGVSVSIGGDVRVRGVGPAEEPWRIDLVPTEGPDRPPLVVHLFDGAVCTSRTDLRSWQHATGTVHHVIDPRNGQPTAPVITAVSVLAAQAIDAEPLTKAALVAGPADVREVLDLHDAPAVIVTADGDLHAVGRIREYLR